MVGANACTMGSQLKKRRWAKDVFTSIEDQSENPLLASRDKFQTSSSYCPRCPECGAWRWASFSSISRCHRSQVLGHQRFAFSVWWTVCRRCRQHSDQMITVLSFKRHRFWSPLIRARSQAPKRLLKGGWAWANDSEPLLMDLVCWSRISRSFAMTGESQKCPGVARDGKAEHTPEVDMDKMQRSHATQPRIFNGVLFHASAINEALHPQTEIDRNCKLDPASDAQ